MAKTKTLKAFAILFDELDRWDVKYFSSCIECNYPIVKLGHHIVEHNEKVNLNKFPTTKFRILGVSNTAGVFHAYDELGQEFNQPYKKVNVGDFAYNPYRINVGSIGRTPELLGGNYISPAYVVFAVDSQDILPELVEIILGAKWYNPILRSVTPGSVRQNLTFDLLKTLQIPCPPKEVQKEIVFQWREANDRVREAETELLGIVNQLNDKLYNLYKHSSEIDILNQKWLVMSWDEITEWDVKTARAKSFKDNNPAFEPLSEYCEEATVLVKPSKEPEKAWPVYGVNNKEGVVFSHYQLGKEFNSNYKRIEKDWFFHNPTRSSVGSLGIVPEVPEDAITSPEYQVWRIKRYYLPGYIAMLIKTDFFIKLIQFHRVGAVKQRLYVENLLQIPIPVLSIDDQQIIADARKVAMDKIATARQNREILADQIEAMIKGF